MPVNLNKVQKKIIKKKGKDAIHENSRDSKIIKRAGGREEKLAKAAHVTMKTRQGYSMCHHVQGDRGGFFADSVVKTVNRVDFFKEQLPEDDATFVAMSDEDLLNATLLYVFPIYLFHPDGKETKLGDSPRYMSRLDEEITQLESEQRKNRPPVKRLVDLREAKQNEQRELESGGFWVPDLTDGVSVKRIRGWNGEWSALSAIKFVRLLKSGIKKPSAFPPRGLS